jgi:hypothetical protein
MTSRLESDGPAMGETAARSLTPAITPIFILRALLGVLLFFCGIVFGAWLIILFRRRLQDGDDLVA